MYHTEHINPIGRLCASCFHVISYHNCCVKSTDLRQKNIFSFPFLRHYHELSIDKNEFIYYFTYDLCRILFDYVIFCRISYNCYIYCQLLEEGKTSRIKTRKVHRKKSALPCEQVLHSSANLLFLDDFYICRKDARRLIDNFLNLCDFIWQKGR